MGSKAKRLGNGYEYEIRDHLREVTGDDSFERVPNSGAYFGGANQTRAATAREGLVEIMSGDIITPPNWRWVVECKNYEDVSWHQLVLSDHCAQIDEFIEQVTLDAKTNNLEPLLFIKLRKKPYKLSDSIKKKLKEAEVTVPTVKTITQGHLVGEWWDTSQDISALNCVHYNYVDQNNDTRTWRFVSLDNWLEVLSERKQFIS